MSWEELYPGCEARFEDERPFELEFHETAGSKVCHRPEVGRAIAALSELGFRCVLQVGARRPDGGGWPAMVTECEPAIGRRHPLPRPIEDRVHDPEL